MPEPLASKEILVELNSQWTASNVNNTTPSFIEATGTGLDSDRDQLRYDLNKGDVVITRPAIPSFQEEPIGNWKYGNKLYNVEIEMNTRQGRQRLYDLMAEIRRICHKQRHAMTQFQRLQFLDFSEDIQENVNLWTGRCNVQVVNQMVLLET